jgi:hypothetical protein
MYNAWTPSSPTGLYVTLLNAASAMCADTANASTVVVQATCDPNKTTQQWKEQNGAGSGSVQYKQVAGGLCIRVASLAVGTGAVVGACDSGADFYTPTPPAYTQIALSNGCLGLTAGQLTVNGAAVAVKTGCTSPATGASGNLMFVDTSQSPSYVKVTVTGSGRCFDSANAATTAGTGIVQGGCVSTSTTQRFTLQRGTIARSVQYKQVASGLCITVPSNVGGTAAVLGTCDGKADFNWLP